MATAIKKRGRTGLFLLCGFSRDERCWIGRGGGGGGEKEQWPMQKRPAAMSELKRRPQLACWLVDDVDDALQSPTALASQSSSQVWPLHTPTCTPTHIDTPVRSGWCRLARDTFKMRITLKRLTARWRCWPRLSLSLLFFHYFCLCFLFQIIIFISFKVLSLFRFRWPLDKMNFTCFEIDVVLWCSCFIIFDSIILELLIVLDDSCAQLKIDFRYNCQGIFSKYLLDLFKFW